MTRRWTRGDKIAAWALVAAVFAASAALAVVPEVRQWFHLEKSPIASTPLAQKPVQHEAKVTGVTASSVEQLRKEDSVGRIEDTESGKTIAELPAGIFGFARSIDIDYFHSFEQMRLEAYESFGDFEVHKLANGNLQIIAYVGDETRERIRSGLSAGDSLTLYSGRLKEASGVVALPLRNIECERIRYIGPPARSVAAVDCRISSAK